VHQVQRGADASRERRVVAVSKRSLPLGCGFVQEPLPSCRHENVEVVHASSSDSRTCCTVQQRRKPRYSRRRFTTIVSE